MMETKKSGVLELFSIIFLVLAFKHANSLSTKDVDGAISTSDRQDHGKGIISSRAGRFKRHIVSCRRDFLPAQRIDCGKTDEVTCTRLGCCFDDRFPNFNNCFIPFGGHFSANAMCDFRDPSRRKDCGHNGINKAECENKNCCFDSRVSGANNCFFSHVTDMSASVHTTDVLELSDINQLTTIEEQLIGTLSRLKMRILAAHKDYSIAKTVGSSVSSAGAIATIAGVVLIPISGGWSLVLSIAGLSGTVLGAGTTLTTGIVETVKTTEYAKELDAEMKALEKEYEVIGQKIISSSMWQDYVKQSGKATAYVVFKGPAAVAMSRILNYFIITAPRYGLSQLPLELYSSTIPIGGRFLLNQNDIIVKALAKIGFDAAKISVKTLAQLTVVAGVAGVAMDIYTIVDTWANDPKLSGQIDAIIKNLRDELTKLQEFKKQF